MRGIVIDPRLQTIKEIDIVRAKNLLDLIRVVLGCKWVERVEISPTVVMFVDEEGLLKYNWHFKFKLADQPIGGRALLLGHDPEDKNLGVKALDSPPLEFIQEHVVWIGGDDSLQRNIELNAVKRPAHYLISEDEQGNKTQTTMWEWTPHKKEEDAQSVQHKGNGHSKDQGDNVGG